MSKTLVGSPVRQSSRPMIDHTRDWKWVNEHVDDYRGQWVMVRQGQFLAADPSIRTLLKKVPEEAQTDAMVTYVPTVEETKMAFL